MKTLSPIPGGLAGPPSACSSGNNHLDAFAVGPDHRVWRWAWDGAAWAAPVPLPAFGAGIPAVGVAAVCSGPGRVEVFAAEASTRSPVWWRGTNGQFLPFAILLPPGQANLPAVAVTAVCSSPDDIDVFAAGAGNTPWWWHWNGVSWTTPVSLPVTPHGNGIPAERIAAVSPSPGRLDVFAAGAGNNLWHWGKAAGAPWGVENLGGSLPAEGVSAVSWGPGRIDVFAASRSNGNALQHWWSDGGNFNGPEEFTGNLVAASVSAVSHASGHLDVFGVTGDQRILHWQFDGARREGPGFLGDAIPAGDVSSVVSPSHRLDVFVAGAGNTLRHWPGGGLENATTQPWINWPTNHEKNPVAGHLWPDSLEELVNIIREAEQQRRGVRAVGSSWSNSDVAVSPDYVVETDRLQSVLTDVLDNCLNAQGSALRLMHVEGGLKVEALNKLLDARGLALKTMGGASGQSIAGVVSTSVHGMDVDRGPIPDMVRAIHLVGPGGIQHWIEPNAGITDPQKLKTVLGLSDANIHYDDDWFNSVLVSMGSLGIIYSLVVEVVPQYDLVNMCTTVDWSSIKKTLKAGGDVLFANRGVQVVVNPYPAGDGSRTCYLTTRNDSGKPPTGPAPPGGLPKSFTEGLSVVLLQNLRNVRQDIDDDVTAITAAMQHLGTTTGFAHTIMGGPEPPPVRGLTVEAMFDAQNSTRYVDFVDAVLEILRSAYYDDPAHLGYLGWISLRFQGRSRACLSPQSLSDRTCSIEFAAAWRMPGVAFTEWQDTPILLSRIEAAVRQFGGIQHWGLSNDLGREDVKSAYPRLDTWRQVRWALTRGGTLTAFDSDFTRRCGLSDPPMLAPRMLTPVADYDGDGKTDFAVWRPGTAEWFVIDSSTGQPRPAAQQWGQAGDIPVPGDYDGDGKTDFAVWRPGTAEWFVIDSSTGQPRPAAQQWGQAGDIPVPGDYDGDGKTDFAVWRPGTAEWFVIDSSTGQPRPAAQQWGQAGDIPVPGDYDGDGKTDFAVWRPGTAEWFVIDSSTGQPRPAAQQWGQAGDIPVPGDYDGDGKTDFAVWRPGTAEWFVIDSSTGQPRPAAQQWGQAGDIPVPGDYDGDGKTDFAVWRPGTAEWFVIDSSTGQPRPAAQQWGQAGDIPV